MKRVPWAAAALVALLTCPGAAPASWTLLPPRPPPRLHGRIDDYTHHHHHGDQRIWSPTLCQWRDLLVYLPPGYDPACHYPAMLWLHGIAEDEGTFLLDGLRDFDAAMAAGCLPPMIIVMPDASWTGRPRLLGPRPLYLNSRLGPWEDYIIHDIWPFALSHYPIRPEREAHVIAGFSGGGSGAYRLALKYPEQFGIVFGISAPLNTRWVDCHGHYFGNFRPDCWGWRDEVRGRDVVGRFALGLVNIRMRGLVYPLFGRGPHVPGELSRENPIEMLDHFDVPPGLYQMLVAYGGKDQFNIDAQTESFIYVARQRGLDITVLYKPRGRHNLILAERFMPDIIAWLRPLLEPFRCPPACPLSEPRP